MIIPKNTMVVYMKEPRFHMVDLSQAITMPLIKNKDSNDNGANINIDIKENN